MCVYVRACVRACVLACVRVCVCVYAADDRHDAYLHAFPERSGPDLTDGKVSPSYLSASAAGQVRNKLR